MVGLGVYKFVKVRFEQSDSMPATLNTFYYLSPANRYAVRAQISALTKSNNSSGTDLTLSFKNNNTFRSAEQLSFSVFGGIETQISGQQNISTNRFGGDIDLVIPRIIGPKRSGKNSDFVPHTKINLGYEYFRRTGQYTLNSFKTSFGWVWNTFITKEHQLSLISINYVRPSGITPEFQTALDTNITLARSIEKQFIIGSVYNFNYNSQAKPNRKRHNFYFNGNADISGNIAGLLTGASVSNGKEKTIFNTPFSQYIRGEAELRHYLSLGRRRKENINQLASRVLIGAGYGYGNSYNMPFIKQFFIGGTNSIRAYRARSLGPGTFYAGNPSTKTNYLPDQPGDIKIELNTELRFKIFSILRGAVFTDAGNIFTIRTDTARQGSKFSSAFFKQLAVGGGIGLRVDIQFIVVRFDVAVPFRKPYLPGGPAWVFNQIDFGSSEWRRENIVYNLAIGYPF
jgi:outer membrane protein assembly factor BamA